MALCLGPVVAPLLAAPWLWIVGVPFWGIVLPCMEAVAQVEFEKIGGATPEPRPSQAERGRDAACSFAQFPQPRTTARTASAPPSRPPPASQ